MGSGPSKGKSRPGFLISQGEAQLRGEIDFLSFRKWGRLADHFVVSLEYIQRLVTFAYCVLFCNEKKKKILTREMNSWQSAVAFLARNLEESH